MLTSLGVSVTPTSLDACLKRVMAYSKDDMDRGCDLDFKKIEAAVSGLGQVHIVSTRDPVSLSSYGDYLNQHFCSRGERVILELKEHVVGKDPASHFVLVTGRNGTDWTVFDPGWHNAPSSLQAHLDGFMANGSGGPFAVSFTVASAITFTGGASQGAFSVRGYSPIELLARDPMGRRVGYDSQAGTNVFEIPGATYFRDDLLADDDTSGSPLGETNGIKTVYVPLPLAGGYQVEVTGTATGGYTLELETTWPGGGGQTNTVSGTTDVGLSATNFFFVVVPPTITVASLTGSVFSLSFTTQSNATYAVEAKSSLADTNWQAVQSVVGTGAPVTATETNTAPMRFYRVRAY